MEEVIPSAGLVFLSVRQSVSQSACLLLSVCLRESRICRESFGRISWTKVSESITYETRTKRWNVEHDPTTSCTMSSELVILYASISILFTIWQKKDNKTATTSNKAVREAATICPRPLQVDFWPFDFESGVRVTCDVGYHCANFTLPRPWLRPDVRDR